MCGTQEWYLFWVNHAMIMHDHAMHKLSSATSRERLLVYQMKYIQYRNSSGNLWCDHSCPCTHVLPHVDGIGDLQRLAKRAHSSLQSLPFQYLSNILLVGGLEHFFFHMLGMSSSQLTISYFSEGRLKPPSSLSAKHWSVSAACGNSWSRPLYSLP